MCLTPLYFRVQVKVTSFKKGPLTTLVVCTLPPLTYFCQSTYWCIIMVYLWALLLSYDSPHFLPTPRKQDLICLRFCALYPSPRSGTGTQSKFVTNKFSRWHIIRALHEVKGMGYDTRLRGFKPLPFSSYVCLCKLLNLSFLSFLLHKIEIGVQLPHRIMVSSAWSRTWCVLKPQCFILATKRINESPKILQ